MRRPPRSKRPASRSTPSKQPPDAAQLLKAIRSMPGEVFYVWDFQHNEIVLGAQDVARLYGWKMADLRKQPGGWLGIIHPDDLPVIEQANRRLLAARPGETVDIFIRIRLGSGRWQWINLTYSTLKRSARGVLEQILGRIRLINDRRRHGPTGGDSDHHRALIEAVGDAVIMLSRDGGIMDANQQALKLFHAQRSSLVGANFFQLTRLSTRHPLRRLVTRQQQGSRVMWEGELQRRDGQTFLAQLSVKVLVSNVCYAVIRDVSSERDREREARQMAEHYLGLFENNASGVAFVDRELLITRVNRKLGRMLKLRPEAMVGRRLSEFCDGGRCALASSMPGSSRQKEKLNKVVEVTLKARDGSRVEVKASPAFFFSADGQIDGCVIVFTDVTDQKRTMEKLWEQSQFNEALIRDASIMVVVMDPQGRIVMMNPATERISGFSSKEMVGRVVWKLFNLGPLEADIARQRFHRLAQGETDSIQGPFRFRNKAGDWCHSETQTSVLRHKDGTLAGFVSTAIDVSSRIRLESEIVRIVESEQTRIGNDLHDGVGQLLTGAASMIEAAAMSLAGTARKDVLRAHEVVRLAVAETRRISHGLSPAAIRYRGLSGGLELLAETARGAAKVKCTCDVDRTVALHDNELETHLYRIAQEAVNNALRHARPGTINVRLKKVNRQIAVLEVQDDGAGFNPDRLKNPGIGLRVMQHRANLVGAQLEILSEKGSGTLIRCSFSLPTKKQAASPQARKGPPKAKRGSARGRPLRNRGPQRPGS